MYSDIYLRNRSRFSAIWGVLAVFAVVGFLYTYLHTSSPVTRASKETLLYHSVVNLSSRQAGVYYQTSVPTISWLVYGIDPNKLDRAAFDERDTVDQKNSTYLHFVPLTDLQANTTYYYKLFTKDGVISINSVDTFSFKTIVDTNVGTSVPPAYGKVVLSNNEPASNAFVIYSYPNAYPLVTSIKGGDWLITLNSLVDKSTGKILYPSMDETVKIQLINEDRVTTVIETALKNTTPLSKTVVLGSPYVIDSENNVLPATTVNTAVAPTSKPLATAVPVKTSPIEITYPKDLSIIPGSRPLMKGLAIPGNTVTVAISVKNAKQILFSTKVSADKTGQWQANLSFPLSVGSYVLTMATNDNTGKIITLKHSFSTTKSGEEVVLGTSTSSGTLTPSPLPSPSPTLIAQVSPTAVPTTVPTINTYLSPTVAPTVIPTSLPSVTPPVTGMDSSVIIWGSALLVIIGGGVLIFL